MSISKSDLQEASKALHTEDIPQLVEWLNIKDDNVRYQAFLLLQNRSLFFDDVYSQLSGEILDKKSKKQVDVLL